MDLKITSSSSTSEVLRSQATTVAIIIYLARRSLCEIINSTLGMLIHRWIGALYFAPASNSRVNREREWCISASVLFANAFRNEAMSVSSKMDEMVCPLSNFESRLLCFLRICEKAFFSELTAGRIFPDFPAIIKKLFWVLFYTLIAF